MSTNSISGYGIKKRYFISYWTSRVHHVHTEKKKTD